MLDIGYIVATLFFFGLMVVYIAACDRLGRETDAGQAPEDAP